MREREIDCERESERARTSEGGREGDVFLQEKHFASIYNKVLLTISVTWSLQIDRRYLTRWAYNIYKYIYKDKLVRA